MEYENEKISDFGSFDKGDSIEFRVFKLIIEKESYRYIKFFRNTKQVGTRIVHGNVLKPYIEINPLKDELVSAEVETFFSNLTSSDNKGKSNRLKYST